MFQRQRTERICEDLDIYSLPPPSVGSSAGQIPWLLLSCWTVGCISITGLAFTLLNNQANQNRIVQVRELKQQNNQLVDSNKQLSGIYDHNHNVWAKTQTKLQECLDQFNSNVEDLK